MKTYVIKQKMSGSVNVHDLAYRHYDREIKFRKGTKYAVVLSSYYADNYTTHKSEYTAIQQSNRTCESHHIIDDEGVVYFVNGNKLESTDLCHTVY